MRGHGLRRPSLRTRETYGTPSPSSASSGAARVAGRARRLRDRLRGRLDVRVRARRSRRSRAATPSASPPRASSSTRRSRRSSRSPRRAPTRSAARANVLANLMVDGEIKDDHRQARRPAAEADHRPRGRRRRRRRTAEARPRDSLRADRRAWCSTSDMAELPIIKVETQAPERRAGDQARERRRGGPRRVPRRQGGRRDGSTSRAGCASAALGAAQGHDAPRGPARIMALVVAFFVFLVGCAAILVVSTLVREWRAVVDAELDIFDEPVAARSRASRTTTCRAGGRADGLDRRTGASRAGAEAGCGPSRGSDDGFRHPHQRALEHPRLGRRVRRCSRCWRPSGASRRSACFRRGCRRGRCRWRPRRRRSWSTRRCRRWSTPARTPTASTRSPTAPCCSAT